MSKDLTAEYEILKKICEGWGWSHYSFNEYSWDLERVRRESLALSLKAEGSTPDEPEVNHE